MNACYMGMVIDGLACYAETVSQPSKEMSVLCRNGRQTIEIDAGILVGVPVASE